MVVARISAVLTIDLCPPIVEDNRQSAGSVLEKSTPFFRAHFFFGCRFGDDLSLGRFFSFFSFYGDLLEREAERGSRRNHPTI